MLTDNRADFRTQDWFLVACDGDLVLKLARDLMIGEDEQGQTVLSPAREDALLRITSEHGCLTLQAMAMDWTFSEDGGLSVQHLTFVEGLTLRLTFPNSTLLITPHLQAGMRTEVDRDIRLKPTRTPTLTLTRVDEPVVLVEPALLPAPETLDAPAANDTGEILLEEAAAQATAAEALSRWAHQIPDERIDESVHLVDIADGISASEPEPSAATARPAPAPAAAIWPTPAVGHGWAVSEDHADEPSAAADIVPLPETGVQRHHHRSLTGLIAAMALLTPMCLFLADASRLGIDFPLSNYRPLSEQHQPPAQPEPAAEAPAALVAETVARPEVQPTTARTPEPGQTPPVSEPARNEAQLLLIASLLAEAKAYYEAGNIVSPVHSNAVNNLTQVLSMDPANEQGLRLMYMSAVALIEEAEAAHAAGNDFLARNLVEDVLGFHPEFDDARALLDSWAREPEG